MKKTQFKKNNKINLQTIVINKKKNKNILMIILVLLQILQENNLIYKEN